MSYLFEEIDQLKKKLDQKRPLPEEMVQNLRDHLIVEWTYHSNSIEGNSLTLTETKVVLEGITIGGKTVREHLEALNHKEAILFLEDIVRNDEQVNEQTIKTLHSIILRGIDQKNAGVYRKSKVMISGTLHVPPDPLQVSGEMENVMRWYHEEAKDLHPVERAAMLHSLFVKIHPFIDGNGRTARLLLNLELMKNGYVPIVIKKEQRLSYYGALDSSYIKGDRSSFIQLIMDCLKNTMIFYLDFFK